MTGDRYQHLDSLLVVPVPEQPLAPGQPLAGWRVDLRRPTAHWASHNFAAQNRNIQQDGATHLLHGEALLHDEELLVVAALGGQLILHLGGSTLPSAQ